MPAQKEGSSATPLPGSIRPMEALKFYFPIGTAEGELAILGRAYVQSDEFSNILTPPIGSPRLLVGKKGSGKSAIIQYAGITFAKAKIPFLILKPYNLDSSGMKNDDSLGTLTRIAHDSILRSIASELGKQATGLLNAEDMLLYETAIAQGEATRDIVSKAARLLPKIAKPIINIDLTDVLPETHAAASQLITAISRNLDNGNGFFLFIDDTDQVAAPSLPNHLNRIWAYLLACREIAQKITSVSIIISLRSEIWSRLIRDQAGQRDQADHFMPLMLELSSSRQHIKNILDRRLRLAARAAGMPFSVNAYSQFFEGDSARMPDSEELRSWEDLIVVRSRERPRDVVQMVNVLAEEARSQHRDIIKEVDFLSMMPRFSEQRVNFLAQEVEIECPSIVQIVTTFAHVAYDYGSFKATAELMREHLKTLPSMFSISLYGTTLKPMDENDAFTLWRYLYELGFLNSRASDIREKDGFRHIFPTHGTSLVSRSNWRNMQAMIWEIHPAYRDFLQHKRKEGEFSQGLPPRR